MLDIEPVPASRPRVSKFGTYYVGRYKTFRAELQKILSGLDLPPPVPDPMAVWVDFVCKRPKKPTNPYPIGDIDNYDKAALDGMKTVKGYEHALMDGLKSFGFWEDDKQIVELHSFKRFTLGSETPHIRMNVSLHGWVLSPRPVTADVLDQVDTISIEELA